jgi:hypothetical protein
MLLDPGESVLRSAYAVLERPEAGAERGGPGVLYLTNRRLLFEAPASRGLVRDFVQGRENHLAWHERLHEIRNVSVRRGRLARPRLVVEVPAGRPVFDLLDPDAWASAIAEARHASAPPSPPGAPISHTIERQVVKVRCRFCGTLANEVDTRCPACGAPI